MPYHAITYRTIPCHSVKFDTMPRHATPRHATPCHTTHATLHHTMLHYTSPHHIAPELTIPLCLTLRHPMLSCPIPPHSSPPHPVTAPFPKHAALLQVRDAFVFRPSTSNSPTSAPDFILSEACETARLLTDPTRAAPEVGPIAGGDHARCLLR